MKLNVNQIKERVMSFDFEKAKETIKELADKYYKQIGTAAVVTTLCTICTISAISNVNANNNKAGVIMTLSDVGSNQEAFAGTNYEMVAITYENMNSAVFENNQLASLEKSEKDVDEILMARNRDRRDNIVIQELTGTQPVKAETETPASGQATNLPAPQVTYADANGSYASQGTFTLTGYCPCPICCGQWSNMDNPTTASGTAATAGRTIAADTSVYPFGTQLMINGQIYTVEDRGGAISGNKIDIFFNSHEEALAFGRRSGDVYVVQ